MTKRFKGLRVVSVVFKILAAIAALMAIAGLLLAVAGPTLLGGVWPAARMHGGMGPGIVPGLMVAPILIGVSMFFGGVIYALFLYAAGEGIDLLLALEENTRRTAIALRRMTAPPAATPVEGRGGQRSPSTPLRAGRGAEGQGSGAAEEQRRGGESENRRIGDTAAAPAGYQGIPSTELRVMDRLPVGRIPGHQDIRSGAVRQQAAEGRRKAAEGQRSGGAEEQRRRGAGGQRGPEDETRTREPIWGV